MNLAPQPHMIKFFKNLLKLNNESFKDKTNFKELVIGKEIQKYLNYSTLIQKKQN